MLDFDRTQSVQVDRFLLSIIYLHTRWYYYHLLFIGHNNSTFKWIIKNI